MLYSILSLLLIAAPEPPGPGAAVLMVTHEIKGLPSDQIDLLASSLAQQFARSPFLKTVISGQELRSMMQMQASQDALSCNDASCLSEVAGALDAPILIWAALAKAGGMLSLNVTLMNVENAQTLARKSQLFVSMGDLQNGISGWGKSLTLKAFGPSAGDRFRQRRWLGWSLMVVGAAAGAANKWSRSGKPNLAIAVVADLLTFGGASWEAGAWLP